MYCIFHRERSSHSATVGRRTIVVAVLLAASLLGAVTVSGAEDLAEPPFWPVGLAVPDGAPPPRKALKNAAILAWVPPQARRIRAVLLIRANTDSKHFGEHTALRHVAGKHDMGIVYLRYYPHEILAKNPRDRVIFQILDSVAKETGIGEFRHAPWITFGKSSVGKFPYYLAWAFPDRTIATISYHAETPTWPPAAWANVQDETILHVSLNGETEWGGTWNRHVRPSLLNYRARSGWLPHLAVAHDVGHGNYLDAHGGPGWGKKFPGKVTCIRVWDYLSLFVDKALTLRLPENEFPTNGPIRLKQVDASTGYLIRRHAVEDMFKLPRIPLQESEGGYVIDPAGDDPPATFVAVPPAKGFKPPSGVPVVQLPVGRSPSEWLLAGGLDFAMQDDPMRALGSLQSLRPKPGDEVTIDGYRTVFHPLDSKFARREGGITLNTGLQKRDKATLLAYTVLEVPGRVQLKLHAPFTQNGRVQVVLSGVAVAHGQVVELQEGLYPMLVVVRLRTRWSTLNAGFETATAEEVHAAQKYTAELAKRAAPAEDAPERPATPTDAPVFRRFTDVPEDERADWFWVADRELAEAWFELHAVHGQRLKPKGPRR